MKDFHVVGQVGCACTGMGTCPGCTVVVHRGGAAPGGGCRGGVVGEQKARAMMAPARAVMMVDAASCDDADDSNESLRC